MNERPPSPTRNRFPDWLALDPSARRTAQLSARDRARRQDAILNAYIAITPASAEFPSGPLAGLPFAAKDMLQSPHRRATGGYREGQDLGIVGDSPVLEGLSAAGADLVGFTNMTELAYEPSGFNATRGRVRNPWNPDFVSGGSSSGSAAAVAAGSVVAALGSDTGGSLRIPAHACGITAWKPTYGIVSEVGAMPLAPTLDSIGLLARSAADLRLLVPFMADASSGDAIRRVVLLDDALAECAPSIQAATAAWSAALEATGIAVEHGDGLAAIDAADRHALIVMQGESARSHRRLIDDPAIAPPLRRRLAKGLDMSDADLAASVAARPSLVGDFLASVLLGGRAALLPVMPIETPEAAVCDPASPRFTPRTLYALSRLTRFVNMLGLPAVACPAGFDSNGLPIAVQLVGPPGSDLALLDLVRHVQAMTDWHGRVPTAMVDTI